MERTFLGEKVWHFPSSAMLLLFESPCHPLKQNHDFISSRTEINCCFRHSAWLDGKSKLSIYYKPMIRMFSNSYRVVAKCFSVEIVLRLGHPNRVLCFIELFSSFGRLAFAHLQESFDMAACLFVSLTSWSSVAIFALLL